MSKKEVNRILTEFNKSGMDLFSDQSTKWLATNLSKIKTQMKSDQYNRQQPSQATSPNKIKEGAMLFFGYDPKTENLKFWDSFPLVIMLHKETDSFLGLNLHYLRPDIRSSFLNSLLRFVDNPNYTKTPKAIFEVTYPMLQGLPKLKPFRAAIKRYLVSSVVTKINVIPSNEWKYTIFMPLEKFQGATREEVWTWANKYSK